MEAAAKRGHREAIKALEAPEFPDALEWLYHIAIELHGRSGVGAGGLMPLAYSTIADYSRLKDVHFLPHEVDALVMLDSVMLTAGEEK